MKITKTDIALILILLLIPLFFLAEKSSGEKKLYLISKDEKTRIPLKEHKITLDGGDVIIEVTKDGARFIESDCPNQICIHAGWAEKCGDTVACVPNKYALVIECKEEEYDGYSE
ncbi:MAG: NusG domain II-containing protein [Deferribacterales bacterium]